MESYFERFKTSEKHLWEFICTDKESSTDSVEDRQHLFDNLLEEYQEHLEFKGEWSYQSDDKMITFDLIYYKGDNE